MNRPMAGRLFRSLGHTALVVLLGFAALFLSYLVSDPNSGTILGAGVWAVLYGALVYGLVYLLQVKLARRPLAATGLFHRPMPSTGRGVALAAMVYAAIVAAGLVVGSLRSAGLTASAGGLGPFLLLLTGGLVCLGIAIGEELLIRGYLFGYLREQHGLAGAAIITSVVFSLMHVMDGPRGTLELLNIIAIGLVLVLLRIQTGSLWAPIGFHWAWNWFDMYLVPVGDQGVVQLVATAGGAGPESDLFTTIAFVAVAVFFWIRIGRHRRPAGDLWRRDAGWAVASWLVIAAAVFGGPLLLRGMEYQVVATRPEQSEHLERISTSSAILPSADLAATQVRAPLAWHRVTGRGVVVLELVTPGDGERSSAAGGNVLTAVAPAVVHRKQAVDGRTVIGVAEEIDIVALPDAAGWEESALIDQVRELVSTGRVVLVGVEGSGALDGATRRRLTQAGAITVGSADLSGITADPLVLQEPADVYAPVGAYPRQAAVLVAAGVAALSLEACAANDPTRPLREQLIAAAITRWQVVDVHTGDVDESLYQVDSNGAYQAVRLLNRRPAVYRALDAARSVGVDLAVSWDVNSLNAVPAWQLAAGQGVKAAVVAEGFTLQRPVLQNRVAARTGFCARPWDEYRSLQGTSTAEAVARVAPEAELLTVLVEEGDQTGRFPAAIQWAVENGAAVVAIPFGSEMNSPAASAAIDFAVSHGTVVVWPAYTGENPAVIRPSVPGLARASESSPITGLAYLSWEYPITGLDCTPEVVGQIAGMAALAAQVAPDLDGGEVQDLLRATGNRVGELVVPDALRFVQAASSMGS